MGCSAATFCHSTVIGSELQFAHVVTIPDKNTPPSPGRFIETVGYLLTDPTSRTKGDRRSDNRGVIPRPLPHHPLPPLPHHPLLPHHPHARRILALPIGSGGCVCSPA